MERTPTHPPKLPDPPHRHAARAAFTFMGVGVAMFAGLTILTVAAVVLLNAFANSLRFG